MGNQHLHPWLSTLNFHQGYILASIAGKLLHLYRFHNSFGRIDMNCSSSRGSDLPDNSYRLTPKGSLCMDLCKKGMSFQMSRIVHTRNPGTNSENSIGCNSEDMICIFLFISSSQPDNKCTYFCHTKDISPQNHRYKACRLLLPEEYTEYCTQHRYCCPRSWHSPADIRCINYRWE